MQRLLIVLIIFSLATGLAGCEDATIVEDTYTLTIEIEGQGTVVDFKVGGNEVAQDAAISLEAVPASGWEFGEWVGEVAENDEARTSIYMDEDKSIKAVFLAKDGDDYSYTPNDYLYEIEASPEDGFYWNYYLFVPRGTPVNKSIRLLVEPNNQGPESDDISFTNNDAKITARHNGTAQNLKIPVLVPAFPRLKTKPPGYDFLPSNTLSKEILMKGTDEFKRIDLQLIKMIEHAKDLLDDKENIKLKEEIFIMGGSASAIFASNFTKIHPNKVRAIAAGSIDFVILPVDRWGGEEIRYPAGISDLRSIVGESFNLDEYKKVAKFYYQGELEAVNDELTVGASEEKAVEKAIGQTTRERWDKIGQIYQQLNIPGQIVSYKATAHETREEMFDDIERFFEVNKGDKINEITPHQYNEDDFSVDFDRIEKVNIVEAKWSLDPDFPRDIREVLEIEGLGRLDFVLFTEEGFTHEIQVADFLLQKNFSVILKSDTSPDIHLTRSNVCQTILRTVGFVDGVDEFPGLFVQLRSEEEQILDYDADYRVYISSDVENYYKIDEEVILKAF